MTTLAIYDRVRETTSTSGTGTLTLDGAPTGFTTFDSSVGAGNLTYYVVTDNATGDWEVGIGTLQTSTTLDRTTVLSSSNSNSLVNFSSNAKDIFLTLPAAALASRDYGFQLAKFLL